MTDPAPLRDVLSPRRHDVTKDPKGKAVTKTKLTGMQRALLILTLLPILGVGVMGGVGTYTNLSAVYGKGTALGALAAGEGATAVMALILVITTALGQSSPAIVRAGLWGLPLAAATMGATAASGVGETIVYAITPMAITASAEGVAFLTRRVVVHQEGRDIEAEARAAAIVRDLAYHQARAAAHPDKRTRARSVKKSWKLAAKVGTGDVTLGADLMDVQRVRLTQGADIALERMFAPGLSAPAPALRAASADTVPALLTASAGDATTPRRHDATAQAETSGYPTETSSDQASEAKNVRPILTAVRDGKQRAKSIAADVRDMVANGVDDVRVITDALATRHGREADDPKFKDTVGRTFRAARAAQADATTDDRPAPGQYL